MKQQNSESENGDVACGISPPQNGELVSNDKLAALKEKNRQANNGIALSKHDQEIVRIIGQHLTKLGFSKTVNCLMKESGCELENSSATRFRECCMNGLWQRAENILKELKPLLDNEDAYVEMKFLLLEQKFLELLEDNSTLEALQCLRIEITPLKINIKRVHELSSLLMYTNVEDLLALSKWEGKGPVSRQKLVKKLLAYFPPSAMLPPSRLEKLIEQAFEQQTRNCIFHNSTFGFNQSTLIVDHQCSKDSFPCETKQILAEHWDEVWFVQFSHNGKYLATGSKDMKITVWQVADSGLTLLHTLDGHSYGISYMAWSPDDQYLLACGPEDCCEVWLWQVKSGTLRTHMTHSTEDSLTCCAWYPDSKKFVVAGTRGQFYLCDLDGNLLESWDGVRVVCVAVNTLNNRVMAADTHNRMREYNFEENTDIHLIQESHPIMSFTMSKDNKNVIFNLSNQGINLWDVEKRTLVRRYRGVVHGSFMIHSCFGGLNNDFIASGSEDNKVYIWHVERESPVTSLAGHTGTVNCVHWNPTNPSMLASASDDGKVRIWGPKSNKTDASNS